VVEHELKIRESLDSSRSGRQLACSNQKIVCQPARFDGREAPRNVVTAQPVGILLIVHLVPDSDEPFASIPLEQTVELVADARSREIDPTDDPEDVVGRGGELKELACLDDVGQCLDENGSGYPGQS
jgi:hypothetical protein